MGESEQKGSKGGAPGNRLREREARASARRKRGMACFAALALVLLVAAAAWLQFQPRSDRARAVKVQIDPETAGEALERRGIIRSGIAFDLYCRLHAKPVRIRPGRYTLSPSMTLAEIVRQLRLGPGHSTFDLVRLSVPEGFTIRQIAARLERDGVADGAEFLQLAMNPELLHQWNYGFARPPGSLEGYLYPDTYDFYPDTGAEKVLETMLVNFSVRFYRPYQCQITATGKSLHQIVTIASLIEREAKKQADRPRIAGVLENRLKKGMRLEIDATVLYALGHHKQRVLFKDLQVDSPYNTYRHTGLPPGPIASPGEASLMAAMMPEKNDFFYYVARPNGYHYFTRTRKEHEAAVKQARAERNAASGIQLDSAGNPNEPRP